PPRARSLITPSTVNHLVPDEMRRTTDARIVVSYDLLALPGGLVFGQVEHRRCEADQVFLDLALILTRRGNNRGTDDLALRINGIVVIQDPPRGFGDPGSRTGFWITGDRRRIGRLIKRNQAKCLVNREQDLESTRHNADIRISTGP